jgi:hypothetical protein
LIPDPLETPPLSNTDPRVVPENVPPSNDTPENAPPPNLAPEPVVPGLNETASFTPNAQPDIIGDSIPDVARSELRSVFVPGRGTVQVSGDLVAQLALDPDIQRALLRDAISSVEGEGPAGSVAHHLVPLEAINEVGPLMTRAAEGGFDINGIENGIRLLDWNRLEGLGLLNDGIADAVQHVGPHQGYNGIVIGELADIPQSLSPAATAAELRLMANTLRQSINSHAMLPDF